MTSLVLQEVNESLLVLVAVVYDLLGLIVQDGLFVNE